MKAVLFIVAFVALFAVATPLTCDNPFFRLLVAKPQWLFPYLTQSALQDVTEEVCPGFNGQETCCDEVVYRRLKNVWELVRADVLAVRVKLAVLQFEVDVLLAEIATLKKEVQQSTTLTDNEKAAIITFLDALATAVTPLVPDILNGFGQCYTAVLKFYAGLLCRACDPVWQDWVLLEGPSPLLDNFRFNFSQATCTGFSDACAPFFAPFYNFKNALISALEQLANNIPDNQTRADVVDRLEDYRPPCDSVNDCLQFICYKFLSGLDRDEDWSTDSFQNATVPGRRRHVMGTITEKVIRSLNKVQRSARQLTARDAGLSGTDYNGSFDPMKQQTTLNTDASTSPSSRVSQPFWFNFLNYFFTGVIRL